GVKADTLSQIGAPCVFLSARSSQDVRGNSGAERGGEREQVIACSMIERAMPRQGKRWHPSANGVVDGEHRRCARRSSRPDIPLPLLLHISLAPSRRLYDHSPPLAQPAPEGASSRNRAQSG